MGGYSDTYEDDYEFYADVAVLPVVPTFVTDDISILKLQQLSQAVSFIIDDDVRPTWHIYKTVVLTLSASTWTNVGGANVAFDSSGISQGGGIATIVTQGYYATEGCCQVNNGTTGINFRVSFLFTAGSSNPNLTNGTTIRYGQRGGGVQTFSSTVDSALATQDICPAVCYPGDTIQFQAWASSGVNVDKNSNIAYTQGRFVVNFTGQMIRMGS